MDKTGFIREFNVTAYTLKGCVHCLHLHELLERSNIPQERITYVDVGEDITKEAVSYTHLTLPTNSSV